MTCTICDGVYCKSEFDRKVAKGKGFYILRHIIVCHAHPNLTFDIFKTLNDINDVELKIAQKKLLVIQKHIENVKAGLNVTVESEKEEMDYEETNDDDDAFSTISEKSKKRKLEKDSEYTCLECQDRIKELSNEKRLTSEFMKHNDELREHNAFLRKYAYKSEENLESIKNTYSSVVTNIPKKQEFARVVIKTASNFKGDAL